MLVGALVVLGSGSLLASSAAALGYELTHFVFYLQAGLVEVLPQKWFTAAQYQVGNRSLSLAMFFSITSSMVFLIAVKSRAWYHIRSPDSSNKLMRSSSLP